MNKLFGLAECKVLSDDRTIEFVVTHEIVDYDQDIIKVDGVNIDEIKKNRSFLWSHKLVDHPIGKIISIKKEGRKIIGKAQMTSEQENPFGYRTWLLIKGGYINNVSMSFIPDRDSIEYKEKGGKVVRHVNKSTMMEISAVNIGSNKNARITNKSLKEATEKAWEDGVLGGEELNEMNDAIDKLEPVESKELTTDIKAKAPPGGLDFIYLIHHFHNPKKEADIEEVHHCIMHEKKGMKGEKYNQRHIADGKIFWHALDIKIEDAPDVVYDHLDNGFKIKIMKFKDVESAVIYELVNPKKTRWSVLQAKIAELELQLKEQTTEEELEDNIYTSLFEELMPSSQSPTEPIDEPNELTIDDLEEII